MMEKITWLRKKLDNLCHSVHLLSDQRYRVSFKVLLLLLCMAGTATSQPLLLNRKISVIFKDQSIPDAIQKLSKETGIRFSYNPGLIPHHRKINLSCNNQPLSEILGLLFDNPSIQFKEIGNQLVIFEDRNIPAKSSEPPKQPPLITPPQDKSKIGTITRPDTVYVYHTDTLHLLRTDTLTITITDTIIHHDTVVRIDTIFMYRTQKAGTRHAPSFEDHSVKKQKFRENNGWYTGISYEHLFGSPSYSTSSPEWQSLLSQQESAIHPTPLNFSLGLLVGYDYYRVGLATGIHFTRLGEMFEYAFNKQTGGYFKTDTVESYYTISGPDTSWYYLTDSTYIPVDYQRYTYKNPNAYRYIEFPLTARFRIIRNESWELYLNGGLITALAVGQKALFIQQGSEPVAWIKRNELNSLLLSWKAGIGAVFSPWDRLGIQVEASYRQLITPFFKDYPLEKKFNLLNIKTGIFVRL